VRLSFLILQLSLFFAQFIELDIFLTEHRFDVIKLVITLNVLLLASRTQEVAGQHVAELSLQVPVLHLEPLVLLFK